MTTRSPFLDLPGAVSESDGSVPAHYGNPLVEQRVLEAGRAVVDCSDRGVVTVTGDDRRSWLHSMASQALDRLAPAESTETLILDAHGHVEYAAHVVDDGETMWLIVDGPAAAPLAAWLNRMRFMARVEVADVSAEVAVLGACAIGALESVGASGVTWVDPWSVARAGGYQYAAEPHVAAQFSWVERVVSRTAFSDAAAAVRTGAVQASGSLAAEALRIAVARPRAATEVDANTLPHELDWLRTAVDLHKGCYRGQETVAKVLNLGRPPRRLVLLHLDGSDTVLPVAGDQVIALKAQPDAPAERREVGHITAAAMHHELGPIALAVVKRAVPDDLELIVESHGTEVAAAQQVIVPSDAGSIVDVPRIPRLGGR
ncbi:MAG TPA: folate-binding protein [Candidatus Lumbricidophila sp.]|nr:folate-binding protein [Candidatus Lumbricidophila sp.]